MRNRLDWIPACAGMTPLTVIPRLDPMRRSGGIQIVSCHGW